MIGQTSSSGKMGNALFQFIFLHQLSRELNQGMFHLKWRGLEDFCHTGFRLDNPLSLARKVKMIGLNELIELGRDDFLNLCRTELQNSNLLLRPGILGSHFFEFSIDDPRSIVKLKTDMDSSVESERYIALHFRGLDFEAWNSEAVMQESYFLNCISEIMKEPGNENLPIKLVTDDPGHQVVQRILQKSKNVRLVKTGSAIGDFRLLAASRYLIASPSTFAFWGGILGPNKTIIHSNKWVELKANDGDKFWGNISSREEFHGHKFRQI